MRWPMQISRAVHDNGGTARPEGEVRLFEEIVGGGTWVKFQSR